MPRRGPAPSPLRLVLLLGLGTAAILSLSRADPGPPPEGRPPGDDSPEPGIAEACPAPGLPECGSPASDGAGSEETYLEAAEVCPDSGYLCAAVREGGSFRIMRWPTRAGRLTVRVPRPKGEDPALARRLQRAAIDGVLAWHGHPFELTVDDRREPAGEADIRIRWVPTLGGKRLGLTEVDWTKRGDEIRFRVRGLTLSTRNPSDSRLPLRERQVMLTAAHEVGHALGLPHSDAKRDVMYPENTATSLSARDYRTLETLYGLPNGAIIRN